MSRIVLNIDLTGSRLGPAWKSVETTHDWDGDIDELRALAVEHYGIPVEQVTVKSAQPAVPLLSREQVHALYTVREHPCLTAGELAFFYNSECAGDHYDDVEMTTSKGLAVRLSALRERGFVISRHGATVDWDITDEGLAALDASLVTNEEER